MNADKDSVSKIDAADDLVEATIPVGTNPYLVEVGHGAVWVENRGDHSTSKIDPVQERVVGIVQGVRGTMAVMGDDLWVADPEAPDVWRVDMAAGKVVARYSVDYTGFLAAGAGSIWLSAPRLFEDQCCP